MLSRHRGFGLIDVLVGVALLLVVFLALIGILRASLQLSTLAKAKATAVEIASTQIEYLRGLSYDALGTVNGIPAGAIPQYATSTTDGVVYTTHTYVEYFDDPADGTGVSDLNGVTTDYKKGKVTVTYTMRSSMKSVSLVSNFVPPGIESSTGGGTLALHVVDADSERLHIADHRFHDGQRHQRPRDDRRSCDFLPVPDLRLADWLLKRTDVRADGSECEPDAGISYGGERPDDQRDVRHRRVFYADARKLLAGGHEHV